MLDHTKCSSDGSVVPHSMKGHGPTKGLALMGALWLAGGWACSGTSPSKQGSADASKGNGDLSRESAPARSPTGSDAHAVTDGSRNTDGIDKSRSDDAPVAPRDLGAQPQGTTDVPSPVDGDGGWKARGDDAPAIPSDTAVPSAADALADLSKDGGAGDGPARPGDSGGDALAVAPVDSPPVTVPPDSSSASVDGRSQESDTRLAEDSALGWEALDSLRVDTWLSQDGTPELPADAANDVGNNLTPAPTLGPIAKIVLPALGQKITPVDLLAYVSGGTPPFAIALASQTNDNIVASLNGALLQSDYGYRAGTNTLVLSLTDGQGRNASTTVAIEVAPPVVAHKIWMDVGFYRGSQNPNQGTVLSEDQIIQQIGALVPYAERFRTFGCTHGLENVPKIAQRFGLPVWTGVWIGRDAVANASELQSCIAVAKSYPVETMVIGSESLLRGDASATQLVGYLQEFRQAVPGVPVTTADVYSALENNPTVVAASDVVFVNYYPFWEGVGISNAIASLNSADAFLRAQFPGKEVIISETGWPSAGDTVGNAVPSPENAASYFITVASWLRANSRKGFIFEWHDEPWKGADDGWGIFDADLIMKPGMARVFAGETVPDTWSCEDLPGGSGTPALQVTVVPTGTTGQLQGFAWHAVPADHYVAVYIHVPSAGWWTKPYFSAPRTRINCDGSWSSAIFTGGSDTSADQVAIFLFPNAYEPPALGGAGSLPQALSDNALASKVVSRP